MPDALFDMLPDDWRAVLAGVADAPEIASLERFLKKEWSSGREIYPPKEDIFNALSLTPFGKVKAVVFGQDPYHGPGEAHGLAFSVRRGVKIPPSLRNIFKELGDDLGIPAPSSGDLTRWAEEGVLLLNTVLTVRRGEPNSHAGRGWEILTDAIAEAVSKRPGNGAVFLLWGKHAEGKRTLIDESRNDVLTSPHPSPFSARRGFFGSKPFSAVNSALSARGALPINWKLEDDLFN